MANVRGILFLDYVRMIKSRKDLDWLSVLGPMDQKFLVEKINPTAFYPMATFERFGNAILKLVAGGEMELVREWGYHSVDGLCEAQRELLAPRDPVESLRRFRVLRATFFDFEALQIPVLHIDEAEVVISYGMGALAEEAASWQTLGFFQRLLLLAGARDVQARFVERCWDGAERTLLKLTWEPPT